MDPVEAFRRLATAASNHLSAEGETDLDAGNREVSEAMGLYRDHPNHRDAMRAIGVQHVWHIRFKREAAEIDEEGSAES